MKDFVVTASPTLFVTVFFIGILFFQSHVHEQVADIKCNFKIIDFQMKVATKTADEILKGLQQ